MSDRSFNAKDNLGSLRGCLVEGDPEQRKRERSVRRRALLVSILLQSTALIVLVLIPLFAKPERIVLGSIATPIPPYHHVSEQRSATPQQPVNEKRVCFVCFNSKPANLTTSSRNESSTDADEPSGSIGMNGPSVPCPSCIDIGRTEGPRPPTTPDPGTKRVSRARIDPAMLIRRVEPVYPPLMRQIRRTGRVELRAVIGTDGTIQSLRVVSGDPGFYQSAIDAVSEWRYKPTVLNGRPVEVDTFITVIYNMSQ